MSKPYKFIPSLVSSGDIPPEYQFVVQIRYGSGFSPVHTIPLVYCTDYETAFECLEAWQPNSKKRIAYVKQLGVRHKHYHYDPVFAEALRAQADLSADEYYEDPTEDERASVRLDHKKKVVVAKWRGIRRDDGIKPDSVLDTWEGGLG